MLPRLMEPPLLDALGWALVHSLWQGAAILLAVELLLALVPPTRPQPRYALAYFGLVLMFAVPATTFLFTFPAPPSAPRSSLRTPHSAFEVPPAPTPAPALRSPHSAYLAPHSALKDAALRTPHSTLTWPSLLALAWLAGIMLSAVRVAYNQYTIHRVWLGGPAVVEAPPPWPARLAQLAARVGLTLRVQRKIRLLESCRVEVPMVIGLLRPVILVPASLFTTLTPGEIEHILTHELIHIRRHDYLFNLLQILLERLLFYHPAAWRLARHIRLERECACDQAAATLCGNPQDYASALLSVEERRTIPAPAVAATGADLRLRIHRLAGLPSPSPFWRWCAGMGAAVAIAGSLWAVIISLPLPLAGGGGRGVGVKTLPTRSFPTVAFGASAVPVVLHELSHADHQPSIVELFGNGTSRAIIRSLPRRTGSQHLAVHLRARGACLHVKIIPSSRAFKPFLVSRWTSRHGGGPSSESAHANDVNGATYQYIPEIDDDHPVRLEVRRAEHVLDDEPLLAASGGGEEYLIWLWVPMTPEDEHPDSLGPEAALLELDEWGHTYLVADPARWLQWLPGISHPGDVDTYQLRARFSEPLTFTVSARGSDVHPLLRIFDKNGRAVGKTHSTSDGRVARATVGASAGDLYYVAVTARDANTGGKYKLTGEQLSGPE